MGTVLNATGNPDLEGVNDSLVAIILEAAKAIPFDVKITDGMREGGKANHRNGYAIDVQIIDPETGNALPNKMYYSSGDANRGTIPDGYSVGDVIPGAESAYSAYEALAQNARTIQTENYPELDNTFRWGGGFRQGGTPFDMMHFDITPGAHGAMAYYNWETGATAAAKGTGLNINSYGPRATDGRVTSLVFGNAVGRVVPPGGIASDPGAPRARPASLTTPVGINPSLAGGAGTAAPPARPLSEALSAAAMNGVNDPGTAPAFSPNINVVSSGGKDLLSYGNPLSALSAPARGLSASSALGRQTSASAGAALGAPVASGVAQPSNTTASGSATLSATPSPVAPVPASRPIAPQVAPTPFQRPVQVASASPVAPTPMPGRPADTAPTRTAAADDGPKLVRLASGKMIAVGTYPSNDGMHATQITDDGTGNAKVEKILGPGEIPGVINPLREVTSNTIAGGVIRSAVADATQNAADSAVSSLTDAAKNLPGADTAANAVSSLGQFGGLFSSALGSFGGGTPANVNIGNAATSALQDIHDRNDDASNSAAPATQALGTAPPQGVAALGNIAAAAKPTVTYETKTNPEYIDWQKQYGGVSVTPLAVTTLQDIHDKSDDRTVAASASKPTPAAPAKTIQVAVQSGGGSSSSRSSSGSSGGTSSAAPAQQTITGTSTGRQYVVGQQYSNNNGTYVAQADGTFQKVS